MAEAPVLKTLEAADQQMDILLDSTRKFDGSKESAKKLRSLLKLQNHTLALVDADLEALEIAADGKS